MVLDIHIEVNPISNVSLTKLLMLHKGGNMIEENGKTIMLTERTRGII